MDEILFERLTKLIWIAGGIIFLYLAFPNLWGSIKYVFAFFSGLVSETVPSVSSTQDAHAAFSKLFPTLILCLFGQLTLFAAPFLTTGSKSLIEYYYEREVDYVKAVSGRIDLAEQITRASDNLKSLQAEIQQCRTLLSQLGRDTETLADAIALSRKTLTAQIKQTSNKTDKGDF